MSKFLRVDFQQQPWGYARVGDMEMTASLSVHAMGTFGVAIGDVVAVSHVWGDAQYVVENVEGASHEIKISSPEKMRRILSYVARSGFQNLWLDNICINEEDDEEKSREVMKMGYVYRETRGTVILLDSTRSEFLEEIMPTILRFRGLGSDRISIGELAPDVDWKRCVDICVELAQDEWYQRVWTVQEIILASSIWMVPVDKDDGYDVWEWRYCWQFWAQIFGSRFCGLHHGMDLGNLVTRWVYRPNLTMLQALLATTGTKCSVERDRVYGVLGLIPNVSIIPRYDDTSLEEVVVTVMKECVNNLNQMDLLHLCGSTLEGTGKHMVPTWMTLTKPVVLPGNPIVHNGNCTYDENIGLMVSGPHVFQAKIVTVIEPIPAGMLLDGRREFFRALKKKLHDDQILELIQERMAETQYFSLFGDKIKAREYFNIWADLASLPPHTNTEDLLKRKYGYNPTQVLMFDTVWTIIGGIGARKIYILSITKDNNCPSGCCKRTYIYAMPYDALVEDNLRVVDYGGHMEGKGDKSVPLIVGEEVQEGVVKFISTMIVDRGLLYESMAFRQDAITIV